MALTAQRAQCYRNHMEIRGVHKQRETDKWTAHGYVARDGVHLWTGSKQEATEAVRAFDLAMSYGIAQGFAQYIARRIAEKIGGGSFQKKDSHTVR